MAGRPTKLTPEMQARLLALIRAGNYMETAAAACGISKDTLYRWMREGARLRENEEAFKALRGKARVEAEALIALSEAIDKALAEAEARDLITIDKAAQGYDVQVIKETIVGGAVVEREVKSSRRFDWQAAAWRLERKFPGKWGRRERIEHTGPDGKPIQTENQETKVMFYIPDNGRGDSGSSGNSNDSH